MLVNAVGAQPLQYPVVHSLWVMVECVATCRALFVRCTLTGCSCIAATSLCWPDPMGPAVAGRCNLCFLCDLQKTNAILHAFEGPALVGAVPWTEV